MMNWRISLVYKSLKTILLNDYTALLENKFLKEYGVFANKMLKKRLNDWIKLKSWFPTHLWIIVRNCWTCLYCISVTLNSFQNWLNPFQRLKTCNTNSFVKSLIEQLIQETIKIQMKLLKYERLEGDKLQVFSNHYILIGLVRTSIFVH